MKPLQRSPEARRDEGLSAAAFFAFLGAFAAGFRKTAWPFARDAGRGTLGALLNCERATAFAAGAVATGAVVPGSVTRGEVAPTPPDPALPLVELLLPLVDE